MALQFERIKRIDDSIKDIINGYVRQKQELLSCEENSYYTIPPIVNYLVILFYLIRKNIFRQIIKHIVYLKIKKKSLNYLIERVQVQYMEILSFHQLN